MEYPNVAAGMKKIFMAEIMALIGSICMGLPVCMDAISMYNYTAFVYHFLFWIRRGGLILLVIAFIINILGVSKASKDETGYPKYFKIALYGIIISLILSVASEILLRVEFGDGLLSGAKIADLISCYYILHGISHFAERIGDISLVEMFKYMGLFVLLVYVGSIVNWIISEYAKGLWNWDVKIGHYISVGLLIKVAAVILSVVYYIMYLVLLNKARKSFIGNR